MLIVLFRSKLTGQAGDDYYEYYKMEVASVIRESVFQRQEASSSVPTLK